MSLRSNDGNLDISILFIHSRETEIQIERVVQRKSLPSLSQNVQRTKATEYRSKRQQSVRMRRVVESTQKNVRYVEKRTYSRPLAATTQRSGTCANISLQRKLYKKVLIAESDG